MKKVTAFDRYYAEQGWFESDYFYPTNLPLQKKLPENFLTG